jgi:hypothetical protein
VSSFWSSPAALRRSASHARLAVAASACLVLGGGAAAEAAVGQLGAGAGASAGASLLQCVTAVAQAERSATFAAAMMSIPGSARMEIRVEVLERTPAEASFRAVTAPGLGMWRSSVPGVKAFRVLKQVTNLSAPAFYRGAVRFRWLSARGHLLKSAELRTPRCEQPAATEVAEAAPGAASPSPQS